MARHEASYNLYIRNKLVGTVTGVRDIFTDHPYTAWTLLVLHDDVVLSSQLEYRMEYFRKRTGAEYQRETYFRNALSLAPMYTVVDVLLDKNAPV